VANGFFEGGDIRSIISEPSQTLLPGPGEEVYPNRVSVYPIGRAALALYDLSFKNERSFY
jgi:hypothetical protein